MRCIMPGWILLLPAVAFVLVGFFRSFADGYGNGIASAERSEPVLALGVAGGVISRGASARSSRWAHRGFRCRGFVDMGVYIDRFPP